jgi:hypothetical protein
LTIVFGIVGFFATKAIRDPISSGSRRASADATKLSVEKTRRSVPLAAEVPSADGVERPDVELDELRTLASSRSGWRKFSGRCEAIKRCFSRLAAERNSFEAISTACSLFSESALSWYQKDVYVEIAVLGVFENRPLVPSDFPKGIPGGARFIVPVLRGMAYRVQPRDMVEIYRRLSSFLPQGEAVPADTLQNGLLQAAVTGAKQCDAEQLTQLAAMDFSGLKSDGIDVAIARTACARDVKAALTFCVRRTKGKPKVLAALVITLDLATDDFRFLCEQLTPSERVAFAAEYAILRPSPHSAGMIAAALPAASLEPSERPSIAFALLRGNIHSATSWLQHLDDGERAKTLNETYTLIENSVIRGMRPSHREWLAVAAYTPGIDSARLGAALSQNPEAVPIDQALKIIQAVPADQRSKVETSVYSARVEREIMNGHSDPETLLQSVPPSAMENVTQRVALRLALVRPSDAMKMAAESSSSQWKTALENSLVEYGTAPLDFRKTWIMKQISDPQFAKEPSRAVDLYLKDLVQMDSAAASQFALQLPESPLKSAALKELVEVWATEDPVSASEWIVGMPPSPSRDNALSELIKAAADDPERALSNASGIGNKNLRLQSIVNLAKDWKSRNPGAFLDLLNSSPLSNSDKQAVIAKAGL